MKNVSIIKEYEELPHIKFFIMKFGPKFSKNQSDILDFLHDCYARYYSTLPKYDASKSNLLSFFDMISSQAYIIFLKYRDIVTWKKNKTETKPQYYKYISFENNIDRYCQEFIQHSALSNDVKYNIHRIIDSLNVYECHKDVLRIRIDNFGTYAENAKVLQNIREQYNYSTAHLSLWYKTLHSYIQLYLNESGDVSNPDFYKLPHIIKYNWADVITKVDSHAKNGKSPDEIITLLNIKGENNQKAIPYICNAIRTRKCNISYIRNEIKKHFLEGES